MFDHNSVVGDLSAPLLQTAKKIHRRLMRNPCGIHVYADNNGTIHTYADDSLGAIKTPDDLRVAFYISRNGRVKVPMIIEDLEATRGELKITASSKTSYVSKG